MENEIFDRKFVNNGLPLRLADMPDLTVHEERLRNVLRRHKIRLQTNGGEVIDYDQAREIIYGMPYSEWKEKHQLPATEEQLQEMADKK